MSDTSEMDQAVRERWLQQQVHESEETAKRESDHGENPLGLPGGPVVRIWQRLAPSLTPDGAIVGSVLGVFAWRMLAELQAPLHRRAAMAHYWIKAMQARYVVCVDTLPGCFVPGNQREVLSAYDQIRKEAGDFDSDELEGLN